MKEHIEREAAIEVVGKYFENTLGLNPDICVDGIRCIPSADVRPVVRSSWELLANGDGICLHCGSLQKHIWDVDSCQNFCGHCGADMRRENDE